MSKPAKRDENPTPGGAAAARELLVPAVMLAGLLFYAVDARHLSIEALIFPITLGAVIIVAIIVAFVGLALRRRLPKGEDEGPVAQLRPWLLVAIPLVLVSRLDLLGAFAALFLTVLGGQLVLGSRSFVRSAAIALAATAPVYFLFKHMLYVRLPAGLFGLG
jgi:hypothetical protein